MVGLDRRVGQRRDATRAPTQARSGWRPSGRLLVSPLHHLRTAEILSKRWGPPHTDEEQALLRNCKAAVKILGFLPQSEALRYMEETDFLLVTMADPTAATGKVYEYLATGKPILAISPKGGEIDVMLRETGAGWCASPDDLAGIAEMLRTASSGGFQLQRNEEAIRRYERPQQAYEFGKLIHSCLASDGLQDCSDHASYVS